MKIVLSLLSVLSIQSVAEASNADLLVKAAKDRTLQKVVYDGSYISMDYPNGDVPEGIGVCTDVIIRSYRKLGVDLQRLVHEDMKLSFSDYPSKRIWGLSEPDSNIDHRRVPNLRVFFAKFGNSLPITDDSMNYKPGDIVTWMLPGNLPHIGIVSDVIHEPSNTPKIIHNIGAGPKLENGLFSYKITGHYRYMTD